MYKITMPREPRKREFSRRDMGTLVLNRSDVARLLNMEETMDALERAFREHGDGRAQMPGKVYITVGEGDFRAMPAAVLGAAGIKWVSVYPNNVDSCLPTVMGVLIYSDPDTGYPLAIMDATEITAYRTAATSAIASKYLARPDSHILGLIGAGRQACMHLEFHALAFSLDIIKVFDVRREAVEDLIRRFPQFKFEPTSAEDVVDSDIVCTLTPSTFPVVKAAWVRPGTHINAVGADAEGKEELEPELLRMARVVVDDMFQASHAGEINVPMREGLFKEEDVWATLGEIVAGAKLGRHDAQEITIFDSTGLAIEDIAIAQLTYKRAKEQGNCVSIDIV